MKKEPNQIRETITEKRYSVIFDGKGYEAIQRKNLNGNYPERWSVIGGGNFRSHYCDEDGTTYRKVVAFVKSTTGEN